MINWQINRYPITILDQILIVPLKKQDPPSTPNLGRYLAHFGEVNSAIKVIRVIKKDDPYENMTRIT